MPRSVVLLVVALLLVEPALVRADVSIEAKPRASSPRDRVSRYCVDRAREALAALVERDRSFADILVSQGEEGAVVHGVVEVAVRTNPPRRGYDHPKALVAGVHVDATPSSSPTTYTFHRFAAEIGPDWSRATAAHSVAYFVSSGRGDAHLVGFFVIGNDVPRARARAFIRAFRAAIGGCFAAATAAHED